MSNLQTAIFDIETDGLLDRCTQVHVLCITEHESGRKWTYRGDRVKKGVKRLQQADELVGHNIIFFDIPAIKKLYPWFEPEGVVTDTLVLSNLIFSNQKDLDFRLKDRGVLPAGMVGKHGLEAWGHRLGMYKGDYAKVREAEAKKKGIKDKEGIFQYVWGSWNQEMEDYCKQDVALNVVLYDKLLDKHYPEEPIEFEHEVAELMRKQEENGFPFDLERAKELVAELFDIEESMSKDLIEKFVGRFVPVKKDDDGFAVQQVPKRSNNYKNKTRSSTVAGTPMTKIKWVKFNPGSRAQVSDILLKLGWRPEVFSEKTGEPSVNADTLAEAAKIIPVAKDFADLYLVKKRLGQVATGKVAWLDTVRDDGRIHHHVNACGTITGRASHSFPNMGQVPSINWSEKDENGKSHMLMGREGGWGYECRDLFYAPEPFILMGADLKGIELRCLAHFMARFDNGQYIDAVLGDPHTVNQKAAGLETRDMAKTFIYATLYGAGPQKIGSIVAPTAPENVQKKRGKQLKNRFLRNTPALKYLIDDIEQEFDTHNFLHGLDNRRLLVRKKHSALNTLLQSAGALISKKWLLLFEEQMLDEGYVHGWDGDFVMMAWVHDEMQVAVMPEIQEKAGEIALRTAIQAGDHYMFTVPTEADVKFGRTWAETH